MNILVKGMEMPTTCYECPFNPLWCSSVCNQSECPLVEVEERPRDSKGRFIKRTDERKEK